MEISPNAGTEALSAADQLRLEGMEEGIQKEKRIYCESFKARRDKSRKNSPSS